jgi:signal transduction histidine kinase
VRIDVDVRAIADESLLMTAMGAVRVGVHNTRLRADLLEAMSELHDSRLRITEAGLVERRRVERNLHDGAQQQFLAVAATLAQTDLVGDEEVREIVATARATLLEALAELRALARGIHPAALSQGGLTAALPSLCERAPWPVALRVAPDVERLPDAVETAAYFLVAEVLANADRHSQAARVTVELEREGDLLHICVSDDGIGGARIVARGGLAGLDDRVRALGGTLKVGDRHPGTIVRAALPIGPETA